MFLPYLLAPMQDLQSGIGTRGSRTALRVEEGGPPSTRSPHPIVVRGIAGLAYKEKGTSQRSVHCARYQPRTVPKIEFMYSRKRNGASQYQFLHSCACEQFIYSQVGPHIWLQQKQTDQAWKYISLSKIYGRLNVIILFGNKEAAQFHFWEHINGSETFILDSYRPFICSAALSLMLSVIILLGFFKRTVTQGVIIPSILAGSFTRLAFFF